MEGGNLSPGWTLENLVTVRAGKTLKDQFNVLISQKGKLRTGEGEGLV